MQPLAGSGEAWPAAVTNTVWTDLLLGLQQTECQNLEPLTGFRLSFALASSLLSDLFFSYYLILAFSHRELLSQQMKTHLFLMWLLQNKSL